MKWGMLLPVMFCASGCGILGPDDVILRIQGTVTAEADGQVLSGALVELYPPTFLLGDATPIASARTDALGHYSLSASIGEKCLGNGFGIAVRASAPPLETAYKENLACTSGTQTVDLALAVAATTP